ncbi:MAG: XTP/dITP diphosphatase [Desulfatiglandales bacterium]
MEGEKKELELILATTNRGKLKELQNIFEGYPVKLLSLDQLPPVAPCIEDGNSFLENALKKALYYSEAYNLPCISDDSGLEVVALGGRPGVHSSRFAGDGAKDEENNSKLLKELFGVKDRRARFVCVLCLALPNGRFRTFEGTVEGEISLEPKGRQGFGYDPLFDYPPLKRTFAELSAEEKNRVSHRGKALAQLKEDLPALIRWIESNREEGP